MDPCCRFHDSGGDMHQPCSSMAKHEAHVCEGALNDLSMLKASQANTQYPSAYDPNLLEAFPNKNPECCQMITLHIPEFTTLCEVTGQPDFGRVTITYVPQSYLVESKSLKLYMFGFRNHRSFHEHAIVTMGKDLMKLLNPHFLEVEGQFNPRGGICIDPYFVFPEPCSLPPGQMPFHAGYWNDFSYRRMLARTPRPANISAR